MWVEWIHWLSGRVMESGCVAGCMITRGVPGRRSVAPSSPIAHVFGIPNIVVALFAVLCVDSLVAVASNLLLVLTVASSSSSSSSRRW